MRNPKISFILSSAPEIPDGMWIAASAWMDWIVRICLVYLLPAFLAINILSDVVSDGLNGKVSLMRHLRTLAQAFGIFLFLTYISSILFTFDLFLDFLSPPSDEIIKGNAAFPKVSNALPEGGISFWDMLRAIPKVFALFGVNGALAFMYYFRGVCLVLISLLAPLAAVFSLLSGPFKKSFSSWVKNYVSFSCQAIVLNIFQVISEIVVVQGIVDGAKSSGSNTLTFVLIIVIFMTPVWTSIFISGVVAPNLTGAMSAASDKLRAPLRTLMGKIF
jgi:hypothetical protein